MHVQPLRRKLLAGVGFLAMPHGLGLWVANSVHAQSTPADQIHDLRGEVLLNGRPYVRGVPIRAGDTVMTGANGFIVFTMQQDAILLRSRSELRLEGDSGGLVIQALRLLTGAVGAVFGKGGRRTIHTPTVTAGIRGTGIYTETRGLGTYFCTCYGTVELEAVGSVPGRLLIESTRHSSPQMILAQPAAGEIFASAQFETHTDAEMDMLEKCVGRRVPWAKP